MILTLASNDVKKDPAMQRPLISGSFPSIKFNKTYGGDMYNGHTCTMYLGVWSTSFFVILIFLVYYLMVLTPLELICQRWIGTKSFYIEKLKFELYLLELNVG